MQTFEPLSEKRHLPEPGDSGWFRFGVRALLWAGLGVAIPLAIAFGPFYIGASRVDFSCPKADTVFVGDSTTEYSVDDASIPGACNFAHSASSVLHTTARLRRYLAANPQTKRVVFGWWPGMFMGKYVENYGAYTTLKHLPMMEWRDFRDYSARDWFRVFKAAFLGRARTVDPCLFAYAFSPERTYWGRYRMTDIAKLRKQLAAAGCKPIRLPPIEPPSAWREFLAVVRAAHAELIVCLPPIYHAGERFSKTDAEDVLKAWLPAGTKVIDLTDLPIPDEAWRDLVHVNAKGAAIVSAELRKRLRK